jgi:hypothetical protein
MLKILKALIHKLKYLLNPNISEKSILEDSFVFGIDDYIPKHRLTTVNSKSEIDKSKITELAKEKKELFKNMIGKYSTPINMNKVREEFKYRNEPTISKQVILEAEKELLIDDDEMINKIYLKDTDIL